MSNRIPSTARQLRLAPLWIALASCSIYDEANPNLRARELIQESRFAEATTYLDEHGIDEDPVTWLLRGEAAFKAGNFDGAVSHYRTALANDMSDSGRALARMNLAESLRAAGDPQSAYVELEALVEETGSVSEELELRMGICCVAAGDMERAREHFVRLPESERERIALVMGHDFINSQPEDPK